jgi:2-alkenal reductase
MLEFRKLKKFVFAGALSAVAAVAMACSSGGGATPTASPDGSAVTPSPTSQPTATAPAQGTTVPVSNPLDNLSQLEIVKAQEEVLIRLFQDTINSVVRIETRTGIGGGEGSGWFWDTEGHIVTNYHVVQGASSIEVFLFDGREYPGRVIGFDRDADLAVVKIDPDGEPLQPAAVGNSSDLQVGQMTVALGNPFGQDFTMTTGIVSALGRLIGSGFSTFAIPSVVQTDAAINPGNSGGPLLNIDGEVIGINTQIRSESGSSSGVGFAVPVDLAKRVVPSLIEDGAHEYSFMGIEGVPINREWREGLDLPSDQLGAYITDVRPNTPAEAAGLQAETGSVTQPGDPTANTNFDGDIIISVDGQPVESMDDLIAYLALNTSPGDDIALEVLRDGQVVTTVVTLGSRES